MSHETSTENKNAQITKIVKDAALELKLSPDAPVLGATDDVEIAKNMDEFLANPEVILATLEEDGEVVGVSVALPIGLMDPARANESNSTAYIYLNAIAADKRGEGRINKLMNQLCEALSERGYEFIEGDAVADSGYAASIERRYGEAIVKTRKHDDWGIGNQTFFRLDLLKIKMTD